MKRLVRHDEGPPLASLIVAFGRVEVNNDDRPAELRTRYALGHVSASAVR